jgi:hypothetical protein
VTAAVVYVLPASEPLQVPPTEAMNPELGVTVNVGVDPKVTTCGVLGEILPLAPADGVTVKELIANEAVTVQLAVIAPVVYVVPTSDPEQPEALAV